MTDCVITPSLRSLVTERRDFDKVSEVAWKK